jgi:GST-like protein
MDARLASVEYFAGADYTIADMAIYGWAWRHARHKVDLEDYPNVQRWYTRVSARPAVVKALAAVVAKL